MIGFQVCDNLYQDTIAAVHAMKTKDVHINNFPARCGHPPLSWEEIDKPQIADTPRIIFGSHCVSKLCTPTKSTQICRVQQCFYLFCPKFIVDDLQHQGAHLLTPGWLANWASHLEGWGFDQKTAIEFFKDSITKFVLLDTGTDQKSLDNLKEMADFLNKPYDSIPVGLEYHEMILSRYRAELLYNKALTEKERAEKTAADYALVQEILKLLPEAVEEKKVIDVANDLFIMLTAPQHTIYIPATNSRLQLERVSRIHSDDMDILKSFYQDETKEHLLTGDHNSLYIKIRGRNEIVGVMLIEKVSFPEHMSHYLNIVLSISGIFGLAIEHARTVEKLMEASLVAGKAELATEMLHNVGNILNSVNISSELIKEILNTSAAKKISFVSNLLKTHSNDMRTFFSDDPKGKKMSLYIEKLSEKIDQEYHRLITEADSQLGRIKLIADIIRTQQDFSGNSSIQSQVDLIYLMEECLELLSPRIIKHQIEIKREYKISPILGTQRSKLLQILLNIIANSVDAVMVSDKTPRQIFLKIGQDIHEKVAVEIVDNGIGMDETTLSNVFRYGFSTKKEGHGFGLHNAANLVAQLSGTLTAESKGKGSGSSFLLTLPIKAEAGLNKQVSL